MKIVTNKMLCSIVCMLCTVLCCVQSGMATCVPQHENDSVADVVELPYSLTQWDEKTLSSVVIEDANADSCTWECIATPYGDVMRYKYSYVNRADDYLYLPTMRMRAGVYYEAVVYMRAGSNSYSETFTVGIATGDDWQKRKSLLCDAAVESKSSVPYRLGFMVDTDSTYRLYLHCTSPANSHLLYIDSVSIAEGEQGGLPNAPTDLTVTTYERDPNIVLLQCVAPTECIDGTVLSGKTELAIYRNGKQIYTLCDVLPGGVICYRDSVVSLDSYTYSVKCNGESGSSAEASKTIVCGAAQVPFIHSFVDGPGYCTVIDNNADGITWHHSKDRFLGCMRYISSMNNDADDWLMLPPMYLSEFEQYQVEYSCCVGLSYYPESFRIMMGVVPHPNEMSIVIDQQVDFNHINDTTIVATFNVAKSGYYYVAMQACSVADSYAILLRNIGVSVCNPTRLDCPESDGEIVRGAKGQLLVYTNDIGRLHIYNMDGNVIDSRIVKHAVSIPLPQGCYIVSLNNKVFKALVF